MYIDPIRINILDPEGKLKYIIIIVGNAPAELRKALESKSPSPKVLEKYYGKSWRSKLFFSKKGGDVSNGEDEISLEDLADLTRFAAPTKEEKIEDPQKEGIVYSYVDIFSFDTILEFKRKLEYITKIPMFCQHLTYYYKNNYFACIYTFEYKRRIFHPNIFKSINPAGERIKKIPINKTFFNVSQHVQVKTYDFAIIVSELREKYNVREYYMFDMRDYIGEDDRSALKLNKNETEMRVIYYGFLLPYFPMLTYQAFEDYVQLSNKEFLLRYPDLQNITDFKRMIDLESNLTYQSFEFINSRTDYAKVNKMITTGIESCILQSFTKYKKSSIIHIRNLFDMLPLSEQIVACSCALQREGGRFIMKKTYKKNAKIKVNQEINQISYKILYNKQTTEYFVLTFNKNGNYFIFSSFREENAYDFHDIVSLLAKIVNPIIDQINGLQKCVLIGNNTIDHFRFENIKFTEVKTFIIWKAPVSNENYSMYLGILSQFSKARIITTVDSTPEYDKYFYNKGVYQIDIERIEKNIELTNYYSFLTDSQVKHVVESLFYRNRVMRVENRSFDMRISIEGMRDKEFTTYFNYIVFSLFMFMSLEKESMANSDGAKSIKSLRIQDPALYNFKKLYNTVTPYSKICQKPFQPVILAPGDKKPGAVKYWNFTTKSSVYYHCPNPKYPNLTFLIKKHPRDYCIPCCKKNNMNESVSKTKIYQKCIQDHIYKDEKKNIETRYIMNYGKFIDPGRICRVPDKIMNAFINNTYTLIAPMRNMEYLIYGVPQNVAGIKNTGILSALVIILEKDIGGIIDVLISAVKENSRLFSVLLNGAIFKYFTSCGELVDTIHDVFIGGALPSDGIPWHDIIRDILFFLMNINVIEFIDSVPYNSSIVDIGLKLPSNITSGSDVRSMSRHILLIRKMGYIYPIFLMDQAVFFSSGIIEKKIFGTSDQVVDIVSHTVDYYKNKETHHSNTLELEDIQKFTGGSKDFELEVIYVNKSNLCYMLQLMAFGEKIYIPINYVYYNISSNFKVQYDAFTRKDKNKIEALNKFLLEYNKWILVENKKNGRDLAYKVITVDNWLVLDPLNSKTQKVIGFRYRDLNFYVEMTLLAAQDLKNAKLIRLYYDPDVLNKVAMGELDPQIDNRTENIYKNLYHYHSYDLFLLEFMNYFNTLRNVQLRAFICSELVKKNEDIIDKIYEKLLSAYMEEYATKSTLQEIKKIKVTRITIDKDIDNEVLSRFKIFLLNDIGKLETQINEYMKENIDLATIKGVIGSSNYAFDFIDIHRIKNMDKVQARKKLQGVAKKLFLIKKNVVFKESYFPNIFTTCAARSNIEFCSENKLIVEKERFEDYLDIFLQDILNPLKEQWLFNIMFAENVFSYFEFTYRKNENTEVVQLW